MRAFLACLLSCSALVPGRAQSAPKALDLLAGGDFSALEYVTMPPASIATVCRFQADGSVAVAGKPIGYVATRQSFDDFRLHVEWRWPAHAAKNSNGGILVHIASGPKDRQWPVCFQIQTKPGRAGDLLPMAGATFAEPLSTPPEARTPQRNRRSERGENPPGEWNVCDILCRHGAIEVTINGRRQNQVTDATPGAGKVGFQLEGTPFELRKMVITPLD